MVLVNVKELVKASWVLICPKGSKNLGGVDMEKTKNQNQIQDQSQTQTQWEMAERVFWKLWSGDELSQEDIVLLMDPNIRRKVSVLIRDYPHTYF